MLPIAEIIAIVSSLVALVSFGFNVLVVRRQQRLAYEDLKLKLDSDILGWGREAVAALADAERFVAEAELKQDATAYERERLHVMHDLSALADQGRFYFPNIMKGDDHGREKEFAFRGHRPPIIHALVFAYYAVKRLPTGEAAPIDKICALLMRCRRLVVSEVQAAIDPRRRSAALTELVKSATGGAAAGGQTEVAGLAADVETLFPGVLEEHNDRIDRHSAVRLAEAELARRAGGATIAAKDGAPQG